MRGQRVNAGIIKTGEKHSVPSGSMEKSSGHVCSWGDAFCWESQEANCEQFQLDQKGWEGEKQLVSFVWNVGLRDRRTLGNRVKMSSGRHVVTLKGCLRNLSSFSMQKKPLKY